MSVSYNMIPFKLHVSKNKFSTLDTINLQLYTQFIFFNKIIIFIKPDTSNEKMLMTLKIFVCLYIFLFVL